MGGALKILGYFPSAEEAALCYSRYLGRGLACEMANLAGQGDQPPTVEEVWATAEAEGVDLNDFRSERNQHGFLGVHRHATLTLRPYQARLGSIHLGFCHTPEEAALLRARAIAAGEPNPNPNPNPNLT